MKKVKLDLYSENDLQFLHELLSDEETKKYFPLMYTTSIEQSELRLKTRLMDQEWGNTNRFLIKELLKNQPVGEISGRSSKDIPGAMELAVLIHPSHRGKGYAKAGTIEFMKYIKENNKDITKFIMEIADSNSSSIAIAQKLEFDLTTGKNDKMKYFEKDVR